MKTSTIVLIVTLAGTFGGFCLIGAMAIVESRLAHTVFNIG